MAIIKSTISVRDAIETPSPIILTNGNWGIWDFEAGNFKDSGIPARGPQGVRGLQGAKGESAIHVHITSQGEFLQRIITRDSQGGLLSTPRKEPLVVGGVKGSDGKNYLRLTAQVIKGGVDVTASALARGGGFTWLYKGSQIASSTATCDLSPAKYADGNEDQFELQLNTARSNEW